MNLIETTGRYLAVEERIAAYERAIHEVVKPGDIVLDLGAGTGILGLLACRAGARRVYSVEVTEIIGLARQICRANGFEDRVTFVNDLSTDVELPEKVDVVVTEQIGSFGIESGKLLEYLGDARERLLKPEGRLIPARLDLYIAPVECSEAFERIAFWDSVGGFDFRPARILAENAAHTVRLTPEHILGEPLQVASLDLSASLPTSFKVEKCVPAARDGWLHGLGGWFSASLSPSVVLSNSPRENSIRRANLFFPIEGPVSLARGDLILIAIRIMPASPASLMMTWKVEVHGGGGALRKAAFEHSTFRGMCLSEKDLARTRPNFIPSLKPRAKALLSVLGLCDGQKTLSEIEQEVFHRYSDLFHSPREAAEFVAKIIRRHSR